MNTVAGPGPRVLAVPADIAMEPLASLFAGVACHYGAPPSLGQRLIANNPGLYRRWLALGSELLTKGALPSELRELVILRVAHNTDCAYEWRSHGPAALAAGVPEAMLAGWKTATSIDWPEARWALVVEFTDQLHLKATIDDALWDRLSAEFSVELILELAFLVGHYTTTAYVLNLLGAT